MKYIIDKSAKEPAYLQLYRILKTDIADGNSFDGGKLPSKRLISEELDISLVTVEHALGMLCDEGYIYSKERSGYYVSPDHGLTHANTMPDFAAIRHDSVSTSSHSEFPFSAYAKSIRRVLTSYGERIVEKGDTQGCPELREAISRYLYRVRGITVSAEQIVIGSGAEALYDMVVRLFGRDKIFAIEDPSYEKIRQVYTANDVQLRRLPLDDSGICPDALSSCDADILHVTPFGSFPSGINASPGRRRDYINWACNKNRWLIEDDYDSEFSVHSKPVETLFSAAPNGKVIYINTFSKSLSSAMRVGYMVLPCELVGEYRTRLGHFSCSVPVFDQYILADFIESGELERHINRTRRRYRREMAK